MKKLLIALLLVALLAPTALAATGPAPRSATPEPTLAPSNESDMEDTHSNGIIYNIDVGTLSFSLPTGFSKFDQDDSSIYYSNDVGSILIVSLTDGESLDLKGVAQRFVDVYQQYFDTVEVDSNCEIKGVPYVDCDLYYSQHPWFCKGALFLDSDNDSVYTLIYKSDKELKQYDYEIWSDLLNSVTVSYSSPTTQQTLSPKKTPIPRSITPEPTVDLDSQLITFRNTPWGISFTEADQLFPEYQLSSSMAGEMMRIYPLEEIITDKRDADFEYSDINIPAYCFSHEFQVAGYTTSNITLYFAYTPVDGILTHEEKDTALYAAKYEFEPADVDAVANDLSQKLSSLYGSIDAENSRTSVLYDYSWSIWWGTNHTGVALTTVKSKDGDMPDEIWISYYTAEGDDWLQAASDAEKERLLRLESAAAESGDTSGL